MKTTTSTSSLLFVLMAAGAAAACEDPLRDAGRFTVSPLEIADAKSGLVWFRCPGFANASGCVESMPVPAETWTGAMEPPRWLPKRRSAWRLASVEELDSIAAKGCKYLIDPKHIDVFTDSLWTRTEAPGGKVVRYGVDRARIESPKNLKGVDFSQSLFVRAAP